MGVKVAVVFHSGYGHTLRMAQSVAEGAGLELVAIDADGNLPGRRLGNPGRIRRHHLWFSHLHGQRKLAIQKFADASSKPGTPRLGRTKSLVALRPAPTSTATSTPPCATFMTLAMQHGGIWVGTSQNYNNTKSLAAR